MSLSNVHLYLYFLLPLSRANKDRSEVIASPIGRDKLGRVTRLEREAPFTLRTKNFV